ncbi:MAG: phytanoyl-CoA dioxygenase family protein [Planctomycetota bacterium]|nr:phytanoyl-CoA dioxygenase family protein [Planctomycetota bacterium]
MLVLHRDTKAQFPSEAPIMTAMATDFPAFERDGVLILDRLLTPAQLAAAQAGVDWAMAHAGGPHRWIKQRSYEWHERHPVFVELIEHPAAIAAARMLLGEDFHLIAAQCSRNTRDDHYAPGVMQFHQDAVFFPKPGRAPADVPANRCGFSAMWTLQETPLAMGPTEFIPGSHIQGDRRYGNDDFPAGRSSDGLLRRDVPAGSLILFNHRTWHRGGPNTTEQPRDLVTNAYARPEVEKVQILTPRGDGTEAYVPCEPVLAKASLMLSQLLRAR